MTPCKIKDDQKIISFLSSTRLNLMTMGLNQTYGNKIMTELRQLQTDLQQYILDLDERIFNFITPPLQGSIEDRLEIYGDGYYQRLIEALEADYPQLKKFMGEEEFFTLAQEYIYHTPSEFFSLSFFGHQLFDFLKVTPPYKEKIHLAELAQF